MDIVLLSVFFVVYIAFLFIYVSFFSKRKVSVTEFFTGAYTLMPYTSAISSMGTDIGLWTFAVIPAVALSGYGFYGSLSLTVSLAVCLVIVWRLFSRRLRLYFEITGSPLSVVDFLDRRFKPSTKLPRVFFGASCSVFSLIASAAAVAFAAQLLSAVIGWDFILCVILCAVVTFFYTIASGYMSVHNIGILQGILVLCAFAVYAVFAVIKAPSYSDASAVVSGIFSLVPLTNMDGVTNSIMTCATIGICIVGSPSILSRFMSMRGRKSTRTSAIVSLVLYIAGAVCALLVCLCVSAAKSDGMSGIYALPRAAKLLGSPVLFAFICSTLTVGLIGGAASHLCMAFSSASNDVFYPLRAGKGSVLLSVNGARLMSAVMSVVSCVAALFMRESALDVFVFASSCLAVTFAPAMFAALYIKKVTPVAVSISAAVGVIVSFVFRFVIILPYAEVLPAMAAASLCMFIFCIIGKKNPSDKVCNEYERMEYLATKNGSMYGKDASLDEENIGWQ